MIPKPFARTYFVVGEPITVPPNLDEAGRNRYAEIVERAINQVEQQAEALAGYPNYPSEWRTTPLTQEECD